jgi:hypothetical protein
MFASWQVWTCAIEGDHPEFLILCSCTGVGRGNLFAYRFSGRQFRDGLTDGANAEFRFGVVEVKRRCTA